MSVGLSSSWNVTMDRRGWGRQLVGGKPGPGVSTAQLQANLVGTMGEIPDLDHHRLSVGVVQGQDGLPRADHLAHLGYLVGGLRAVIPWVVTTAHLHLALSGPG